MDKGAKGVKIVALYVFPAIILILVTILFVVPIPQQTGTLQGRLVLDAAAQPATARTIVIYPHGSEIPAASIHPLADGSYNVELPVNTYTVTLAKFASDRSSDVPKSVRVTKNTATRLDISVDTDGI